MSTRTPLPWYDHLLMLATEGGPKLLEALSNIDAEELLEALRKYEKAQRPEASA